MTVLIPTQLWRLSSSASSVSLCYYPSVSPFGGLGLTYIWRQGFFDWKQFVYRGGLRGRNKIGQLFSRAALGPSCVKMSEEEIAAYQAPFPTDEFAAGAHVFPELVPTPPSDQTGRPQLEGGAANRALWAVFQNWTKPVSCIVVSHGYIYCRIGVLKCWRLSNVLL